MPEPTDTDLSALSATPPGLYRHYKGGWYEVIDTVRCSETLQPQVLYRALYGGFGLWVRPAAMFMESGDFAGAHQARFTPVDLAALRIGDLATARAVVAHLTGRAWRERGAVLERALRAPPPEPDSCCGRGCNGCVWEGYYEALHFWVQDVGAWFKCGGRP
jgi:hypothetical protein